MQQKAALLSSSVVFSEKNGLAAEPLPPHLALITLFSQLCQHNFLLQQHCEPHHFREKQKQKQTKPTKKPKQ